MFLLWFPVMAQKHVEHVIEAGEIKKIVLSSDEIYRIDVKTIPGEQIRVSTDAEGEYFNEINLDLETREHTLYLNSRYREILQSGFDKLSAHKVFSMEVALQIPEGMVVEINSNVASAFLAGSYEHILIQLKKGSCYLKDFKGSAVINTYDGNIWGTAINFAAEANSRHGKMQVPQNTYGIHKMVLTSINGDIKLSETK